MKIKKSWCLFFKDFKGLRFDLIDFLMKCKEFSFLVLIFFISVFRNGLGIHGATKDLLFQESRRPFDLSEYSSSPLILLLRILVKGNYNYWIALHLIIIFLVIFSFVYFARKLLNHNSYRISVLLFSLSPLVSVMFKTIGYYDPLIYLAIIFGTLTKKKTAAIFSGLLFATSHSQAAAVSSVGLYFMLKYGPFRRYLCRENSIFFAKISFFSGLFVSFMSLFFWRSERYTLIKGGLGDAIYSFFFSLPQHVYCTFGGLWIFIFMAIIPYLKNSNSLTEPTLLMLLAFSVQLITNDGTRISLLITGSSIIIFIIMFSEKFYKTLLSIKFVLFLGFVTPAIIVQNIYINPSFRQIMIFIKGLIT